MTDTTSNIASAEPAQPTSLPSVAIIGAGLSGISAAHRLHEAGYSPVLFDQGRTVGGRMASKNRGSATFDQGAQFFTTRSDRFTAEVARWVKDGAAVEWCQGFGESDGYARYRGALGMSQLAKHLAEGLQVELRSRVGAVVPLGDCWSLNFDDPELSPWEFDSVILACPAPAGLDALRAGGALMIPEARERAESISYHRVLACMVTVDRAVDFGPTGARQQPEDPTFSFIADNQVKGISAEPAVTFHVGHAASERLWSTKDKKLQAALADDLAAVLGDAKITSFAVKRWSHSGPVDVLPESSLTICAQPGPVIMCGDAFGGAKVEGAFLSGLAAAESLVGDA